MQAKVSCGNEALLPAWIQSLTVLLRKTGICQIYNFVCGGHVVTNTFIIGFVVILLRLICSCLH